MQVFRWSTYLALGVLLLMLGAVSPAYAQQEDERKEPPSEGFADTLRRMQIKRAEEEHKKLIKSAKQAAEIASTLSPLSDGQKLDRKAEKKLKEIEKAAKQIRRNIGGANDEKDFAVPKTLNDAIEQLAETSKTLSQQMEKTSRHVTSATIIVSASDMLRLIKILREYLN
jgi:flagellar biosynthesis chaperone FliJ